MEKSHVSPPATTDMQSTHQGTTSNGASLEDQLRAELFQSLLEEVKNGKLDATTLSL